ncbi:MAG: GNAT family N-acetyltransferase [candidate division Zixibacteria bacterium]|nr:GNAT family N-acetyltransferase [candidate division Zixibacteria bacterium]
MNASVRQVAQPEIKAIRQAVLRPYLSVAECDLPGDEWPETAHFAAFSDNMMVSIASIYHEPPPGSDRIDSWRLRGMATLPECRGGGYGTACLQACLDHVRSKGGQHIWCNARTPAVPFYERYGFRRIGEEFEIPKIGPHYVMEIEL